MRRVNVFYMFAKMSISINKLLKILTMIDAQQNHYIKYQELRAYILTNNKT